jgi:NAD(P)-dependent dehydrogenase (short-subunit alcohol dehydrogenase family)
MRFENKVAVVTGAGGGIGEAYAKRLAAEGASVLLGDIDASGAERVAKDIVANGGRAQSTAVDVSDADSTKAMARTAIDEFGGIDFLVNNAAIYRGMRTDPLMEVDWDYYTHFMDVNLNGALRCARACYRHIADRGGGVIVNQSSTAAWMASPVCGYYSISKAAINALTANLASELGAFNIRVNAIAPGPTDTAATREILPDEIQAALLGGMALKRLGQPEDIAGTLVFLLSEDAAWLTGKTIAVDGGQIIQI